MSNDFFQSWDATNEEQMGDFSPIPEGKYLAQIVEGEWKRTSAGTGEYLELMFEIIQHPQYSGRRVWTRLNLRNPSSEAVRIAKQELSSICHATGVMSPRGIPELLNIPMLIAVKLKKREDNGQMTNEVKGYEPKPRLTAAQAAPAPAVSPVAVHDTKPW